MHMERVAPEEIERIAREGFERVYGAPGESSASGAPRNAGPTLVVTGGEHLEIPFRGRWYRLRPVGWEDGLRLVVAKAAIDQMAEELDDHELIPESVRTYSEAMSLVVSLVPKYLTPKAWWGRRLRWRLRLHRNPFRWSTDAEVGQLLGFFLASRTMSRVRSPDISPATVGPTSSTRASSSGARSGRGRRRGSSSLTG